MRKRRFEKIGASAAARGGVVTLKMQDWGEQ